MCKSIFPTSMTPAEGSDLDKVVRPLSRGRRGVLHIVIHRSSALRALCGFLKKVDSVNVTLLLILLYVDFLAFSPVRG